MNVRMWRCTSLSLSPNRRTIIWPQWDFSRTPSHTSRDAALQSHSIVLARQTRLPYDLSLFHLCKVNLGKKSNASLCGVIAYVQRTWNMI